MLTEDTNGTVLKYQNGPGIDNKLSVKQGTTTNYFLADHLGSTNALTDSTGAITASQSYDSFGNPMNSNFPTRYQFTGREYDQTTGLQFSRARMYDPNLGRFISEDPIGFRGGDVNLYGYVRNRPLIFRDSRGLYPGEEVLNDPNTYRGIAAIAAAVSPYIPPVAVATGGAALIYGASYVGEYTANHPSNPFVNGPLNPFGTPYPGVRPLPPAITSTSTARPYCQPVPRAIPFYRTPTIPWPSAPPDRDGCAEEISACYQLCANAQFDPDMKNIWGGSMSTCLRGCISARCQKGLKF